MKKFNNKDFFKNLKKTLLENLNIKLICLLIALVAYLFIGVFQKNEKTFNCKANIVGLKDYLSIENDILDNVKVIAKDKQKILDKISDEEFNVRIDLTKIDTPDSYSINFDWDLPKSMKSFFSMVEIVPPKVEVIVDKLVEKNIPIVVNYFGKIEENLILKKTVVNPTEVRVQGPDKLVNKLKIIETEKINIQGENQSFFRDVNLNIPYKNIKIIGKNKVEVYFEIAKETDLISFKFDSIYHNNLSDKFRLVYDKIAIYVKISGFKTNLANISKDNIVLMVDCNNIEEEGAYYLPIEVALPKGADLAAVTPSTIKVEVRAKRKTTE
ncbi:MAG TPA: CdaR family protein [Spirochaetota bacterium]|nr:CdaR family protein [Spirochaetota bacterium]